ncbi:hypothetical protein ACJ6WF_48540 [Streptomyces sp. MMS24-I2-30]
MDTDIEFETVDYTTPALSVLGTVTGATLGSAGNNNADDTQYWQ